MEFGDFAMRRRMLRGIKSRAEAVAHQVNAWGPRGGEAQVGQP
jgi:hypothetical protein